MGIKDTFVRMLLKKPVAGLTAERSVELGAGNVVTVPQWQADKLERQGAAEPAPPIDDRPAWMFGPTTFVKITAPKKPPLGQAFYEPGVFLAPLGRFVKNLDGPVEVPEDLAGRLIKQGLAAPA